LFEYVGRGSEDEISIATNRSQLDAPRLAPAVLVGVSGRSPSSSFRLKWLYCARQRPS
jgi:L-lactate dehydrogenase (cytochrome)